MSEKGMNKNIKLGMVLLLITAITGLVLGFVHELTLEPIHAAQEKQKTQAYQAVLPQADTFTPLEVKEGGDIKGVLAATKSGAAVGHVITAVSSGYAGPITMVVGIADGKVTGMRILNQTETPGLGANADKPFFFNQFADKKADAFKVVKGAASGAQEIQALSGATITSVAVAKGVNAAITYWNSALKGAAK